MDRQPAQKCVFDFSGQSTAAKEGLKGIGKAKPYRGLRGTTRIRRLPASEIAKIAEIEKAKA